MTRLLGGIYTITNTANGHRYVGSAVDMGRRWHQHKSSLLGNSHHSIYLQRAWDKYGESAFKFEILERWEPEFLVGMEQWWMNMLQPEYNICKVAGSTLGHKHTDEARKNMAAAQTGKKHTKEHRANVSAAKMGNTNTLGHVLTKEHKAKISATNMGHKTTEETKGKISAALTGRVLTRDHKSNISVAKKGKPWSDERRAAQETLRARKEND